MIFKAAEYDRTKWNKRFAFPLPVTISVDKAGTPTYVWLESYEEIWVKDQTNPYIWRRTRRATHDGKMLTYTDEVPHYPSM